MNDTGSKALLNIIEDVKELAEKMKRPRPGPLLLEVPDAYGKYAADLYRDQNVTIRTINGAIYQHGVQIKPPGTKIDVTRLNERIAAMDLPNNLRKLSPAEREVHLLGKWHVEEKGESDNG